MRTWFEKLQRMAAATAFAEAGEWQTARSMVEGPDRISKLRDVKRTDQPKTRLSQRSYRV